MVTGEQLLGQYQNNLPNGKGTYYYVDGNKYCGDWVDGHRTGQGVFIWSEGGQYERNYSKKIELHFL